MSRKGEEVKSSPGKLLTVSVSLIINGGIAHVIFSLFDLQLTACDIR